MKKEMLKPWDIAEIYHILAGEMRERQRKNIPSHKHIDEVMKAYTETKFDRSVTWYESQDLERQGRALYNVFRETKQYIMRPLEDDYYRYFKTTNYIKEMTEDDGKRNCYPSEVTSWM